MAVLDVYPIPVTWQHFVGCTRYFLYAMNASESGAQVILIALLET